ncbi:DUF2637 domain-containing protein [Microbacterium xylanilyticum]
MAPSDHRAARINPDRQWVATGAIGLVLIVMLASFVFSFVAIMNSGIWAGGTGWVAALAPLFIDGPILMYTTALAIYRARHDTATVVRRTRRRLWAFTFASVLLNAAHASAFWQWDYTRMEAWFGTLVAALAPLAALLSAEELMHLAFTDTAVSPPDIEPDPAPAADDRTEAGDPDTGDGVAGEQDLDQELLEITAAEERTSAPVIVGGAFAHPSDSEAGAR